MHFNPAFSEPQSHWSRGFTRPRPVSGRGARGGSCSSGERRCPAAPGEDKAPSPDHKPFHTSNSHELGTKTVPPRVDTASHSGSSNWLVADWMGFVEFRRTRGGQGLITSSKIFPCLYNSKKPGTKTVIPRVDTAPHGVETPIPLAGRRLAGVRGASGTRGG